MERGYYSFHFGKGAIVVRADSPPAIEGFYSFHFSDSLPSLEPQSGSQDVPKPEQSEE
jgi:hypothetical protein